MTEKLAVKTKEAAEMIGMSSVWLEQDRRKERSIGPPFIKRGKAVLYVVEDLKKWLKEPYIK